MDFFCLSPIGIRAGYPSAALLRTLPRSERRRLQGHIVLLLTANRRYALRGVRPGARVARVSRKVKLSRAYKIGLNTWYLAPNGSSRGIVKVRHGIIQEVGIADKRLMTNQPSTLRFLELFRSS
jgi:hypothetical protein